MSFQCLNIVFWTWKTPVFSLFTWNVLTTVLLQSHGKCSDPFHFCPNIPELLLQILLWDYTPSWYFTINIMKLFDISSSVPQRLHPCISSLSLPYLSIFGTCFYQSCRSVYSCSSDLLLDKWKRISPTDSKEEEKETISSSTMEEVACLWNKVVLHTEESLENFDGKSCAEISTVLA